MADMSIQEELNKSAAMEVALLADTAFHCEFN